VRWWWARAPEADLGALARALEAGRLPPDAALLKAGDRRQVWRLPDVAGGLLVKRFAVRGAEVGRFLVAPSRARAEYRAMEAFCRLGLPTVRPLGFGERRERLLLREAWFVGRLVPDARTVGEAQLQASARGDVAAVRALARGALDVTEQMHRHPWLHRDLHVNNLLVAPGGEVLVTDLHSVRRVPRLTRAMRVASLARLFFSMRPALDLREAPALLRAYAERRAEDADALILEVVAGLDRFERDYVRGRAARCLVRSSLFTAERVHDGRLFRRRTYDAACLREDLLAHPRILQRRDADVLGRSPGSDVTRVTGGGFGGGARVLKVSTRRGLLRGARQWLGLGRARRAWVAARALEVLGLSTPEGLALLERPDGSAVLVTREVAGARGLRSLLEAPQPPPRALRSALALALGHVLGRLARAGLVHHDLSTKNVLVTDPPTPPSGDRRTSPPAEWPRLWLIDLDNMRPGAPFARRGLVRMLGQLGDVPAWVSRTDRRRFALGYERSAGRALPRDVAAEAAARSAARAARRSTRAPAVR